MIGYTESLDASTKEITQNDLIFRIDLGNLTQRPDYERQPDLQNTLLNNNISNARTVFEKSEHTTLTVRFSSEDGVVMSTSLNVNIIPRGFYYDISQSDDRQKSRDYIELYTNELVQPHKSDLRETFIPIYYSYVQLEPKYGYEAITSTFVSFNAKLDDSFIPITTYGENIKVKFHLRITVNPPEKGGGLMFSPKIPVIEEKKDVRILYKICLTAEERQYGKASPVQQRGYYIVRVHGEPVESEFHERHKMMRTISNMIRLFELEDNDTAINIEKRLPQMSTYQMRIMIGWLFEIGNEAQKKVKTEAEMWDTIYTVGIWTAYTTKFVCDVAFSIILKYVAAQYGANPDIVEGIITPVKEFFEDIAVKLSMGEEVNLEILVDKCESILENTVFTCIENGVDDLIKKGGTKIIAKFVSLVAIGALMNFGKHWYFEYLEEMEMSKSGKQPELPIFWRVMKKVFADMTAIGLKITIAKMFTKRFGSSGCDGAKAVHRYELTKKMTKYVSWRGEDVVIERLKAQNKAFVNIFQAIALDATINKTIPEAYRKTLDAGNAVFEDACRAIVNDVEAGEALRAKMYDNLVQVADALEEGNFDDNGFLIVKTVDNETIKLPTVLVISDLVESIFNKLNISEHLSALFSNPPNLPDEMPYQSYKDTREALRMYGLMGEAKYLDSLSEFETMTQLRSTAESIYRNNPVAQQLDPGLFDSSTQPGTFNAGTDFRRYYK